MSPAIFSIIGTAFSVIGAINQGQQAKAAANYNAQVAQNNAIAARQQAEQNAEAQRRKAIKSLGSIAAGYGASGVSLEGSPLDVMEESARMAELDRLNILYGGDVRAQGYESTAALERSRGKAAETASYFKAGSALLSGGSQIYGAGGFGGSVESDTLYFDDWNTVSNMRRVG